MAEKDFEYNIRLNENNYENKPSTFLHFAQTRRLWFNVYMPFNMHRDFIIYF